MFKFNSSPIRKTFFKRLIYIILSIIPVWFLAGPTPWRYLGLVFFVFAVYHILQILKNGQIIIDDFFPPKVDYEITQKPLNQYIYYSSGVLFFVALIFSIIEHDYIENTIDGFHLFWNNAIIGLVLATILTYSFKRISPTIYHLSDRRFSIYFCYFIGCFLLLPATASFINHQFAPVPQEICKKYVIQSKSTSTSETVYWFFIKTSDKKVERFKVGKYIYNQCKENTSIQLCTKRGKLDYEYVTKIIPPIK